MGWGFIHFRGVFDLIPLLEGCPGDSRRPTCHPSSLGLGDHVSWLGICFSMANGSGQTDLQLCSPAVISRGPLAYFCLS